LEPQVLSLLFISSETLDKSLNLFELLLAFLSFQMEAMILTMQVCETTLKRLIYL
jgi:hypothetical protein